ncbi:MAG: hypothetical protein AUH15_05545 [Acidobacteriales bacterium 13_2_20CM_55_8]|nr:MAG: hypothetical protein AUH15_05545 [Acidobacteriales bacterium 13_2_20CM_55_8]
MGLDIRLPIGGLFTVLGLLLAGYGLVSEKALYERSLGINVNLEWGLVMLIFGVIMVVLGRRGTRNGDNRRHEVAQHRPDTSHH